jgi:short-subunit dehydrogenase
MASGQKDNESARKEGTGRHALITGASAGIGRDLAEIFARNGFDLVLVARREKRLHEIARDLEHRFAVTVHAVTLDLAEPGAAEWLHNEMRMRGLNIDALICNAGFGVAGFYRDTSWADQHALCQVMMTGVAELCHRFAPDMGARGYGRILNVASLAGFLPPAPGGTLYIPAKAFEIKLSQALALEYTGENVHVTALCPGFTYTEFHDVMGTREAMSAMPRFMWMKSKRVAEEGYKAVMQGKPVHIPGRLNRFIAWLAWALPSPAVNAILRRQALYAKKP